MGIAAVLSQVYSFYLGRKFTRNVFHSISRTKSGFKPSVALIMPCKGNEPGLEKNIEAALRQNYPHYEVAIVTDSLHDEAYSIAKSVIARNPECTANLYVSEQIPTCSGKVAALLTGLSKTRGRVEAYAFIDSDSLVAPSWLAELVDPLDDHTVGATTAFRWYFPLKSGFWSHIQSAWNAAGTNLFFDDRYNFPWGGATAVRNDTLDKINIGKAWLNAISDDMALNSALRRNKYRIVFLPQCTVASYCDSSMSGFLEWAIRQSALTKTFNEGLWRYALVAFGFLDLVFLLGATCFVLGFYVGPNWLLPSGLLLSPSIFGVLRSNQRSVAFRRALPHLSRDFKRISVSGALLSLIMPWIMTYCIVKSGRVREIQWRGRRYPLKGETKP